MAALCDKFDGLLQMETFRLSHAEIAHDSAPLFPMRHAWLSRRSGVKVVGWEKSANQPTIRHSAPLSEKSHIDITLVPTPQLVMSILYNWF